MRSSDQIQEIAAALAAAQGDIGAAKKDSLNPFFKSKYADLASVKEAIREPFRDHGLSYVQSPTTVFTGTPEAYEWTARSGEVRHGVRVFTTVSIVTLLLHSSGQWIESEPLSALLPSGDPQSVGSAISYLKRYALQAMAGVVSDDDDAETTVQGKSPAPAAAATPPPGYADWLNTFTKSVDKGIDALRAEWKAAEPTYRDHLTATNPTILTKLSAAAQKVTDTAASTKSAAAVSDLRTAAAK